MNVAVSMLNNHRVVEPNNNKFAEDSEREQHTSANTHHLEILPMTDYVQMSPQPIAPSLQQKLMSHGCGSPSWSFQPDTAGTFVTCDTQSTHAFLASTTFMNKPVAPNCSTSSPHPFEGIDLDHEKGESFSEQSEQDKGIKTLMVVIIIKSTRDLNSLFLNFSCKSVKLTVDEFKSVNMFQYFLFTFYSSNQLDNVKLSLLSLCLKFDYVVLQVRKEPNFHKRGC